MAQIINSGAVNMALKIMEETCPDAMRVLFNRLGLGCVLLQSVYEVCF